MARQLNYYWIPGGAHTSVAIRGYIDAVQEIMNYFSNSLEGMAMFVPCGTGTTQAGIIAGINGLMPVYGVSVARNVARCKQEISALLGINETLINVLPSSIKYGAKDKAVDDMISKLVQSDGVFLDPIYNAKSFLAMIDFIKKNQDITKAIYINTGGYPNIFE